MTAIEYLDSRITPESSKKTKRQILAVKTWVHKGCRGTIEWPTGVGKTRCATEASLMLRREDSARSIIVVVPTLQLQEQWTEGLQKLGLSENTRVIVVNTIARMEAHEFLLCELLILDEIHRYAAKTFSKVFQTVKYDFVLGLTATMKRLDKKHSIIEQFCPIIDRMSIYEAKREKFIAEYREYNLGIEMTPEELDRYTKIRGMYAYCMNKFHQDFDLMKRCSMKIEPVYWGGVYKGPPVIGYASKLGWRGNTPWQAWEIAERNKTAPRGQKKDVWGNPDHPYSPQRLQVNAINGMRSIREIKEFVYTAPGKLSATVELIKAFNRKTIVFGEIISRAEEIHAQLADTSVMYHSKMKAKEKKHSLAQIMTNPTIKAVVTARALDQGFDWPEVELGIIESRTSSPTQQTQRRGRVVRLHLFEDGQEKEGVIINIYVKDTKDYDWLTKGQFGSFPAKWVDSIEEILRAEGLLEAV